MTLLVRLYTSWRIRVYLLFIILILLGVPVWWQLTTPNRATMPLERIAKLPGDLTAMLRQGWTVHLHLHLVIASNQTRDAKVVAFLQDYFDQQSTLLRSKDEPPLKYNRQIHSPVRLPDKWSAGEWWSSASVDTIDAKFHEHLLVSKAKLAIGHYHVLLLPQTEGAEVFVGLGIRRTAVVKLPDAGWNYLMRAPEVLFSVANLPFRSLSDPQRHDSRNEMKIKLSTAYRLSFVLATSNPEVVNDWDFVGAAAPALTTVVNRLNAVANFTIESQVVRYAKIDTTPKFSESLHAHFLTLPQLPYFLDRSTWRMDMMIDTLPVLTFALFVPEPKHNPLVIAVNETTAAPLNAFAIPQWGDVVIYNPTQPGILGASELGDVLPIWIAHLREFLGIPSQKVLLAAFHKDIGTQLGVEILYDQRTAFTDWELDRIRFERLLATQKSTVESLTSFLTLISDLRTIPVQDNVGLKVNRAVADILQSFESALADRFEAAYACASSALDAALETFFDKGMLAILYFPEDHKFAIYVPLFVPIFYPLFMGLYSEYQRLRKKWRSTQMRRAGVSPDNEKVKTE